MDTEKLIVGNENFGASLDNLYPALTQCFAIILCGYFAGRLNLVSESEAKGMNTFVGTFSLPSLIFMSLAKLDLSSVNWLFLASIFISKSIIFFAVIAVTLLVLRPLNLGRAGLFAIFCSQSNDFAIGYPIVEALYGKTHPDYGSYLYLMSPINLAILNPIAFVLMEIGKRQVGGQRQPLINNYREISDEENSNCKEKLKILSIGKSIIFNPIVFMTILGIVGNLIFKHNVPVYVANVLEALGSAFSASALFLLGIKMVGKVSSLKGSTLVVPGILIMVKLIAFPLVAREVISILRPGVNSTDTQDLSTYGFFYGTFPSAPGVFVFATQYSLDVDLIASSMVACTFMSAPLMFISAKMITLTKTNPSDYIRQLDVFTLDISIVGLIACVWVLFIFFMTKKVYKTPHKITAGLIFSQLLSCLGAILWNTLNQKEGWQGFLQFTIFIVGVYSTRLWTSILAVTLVFLRCRSLCFVLKLEPYFILIGWGIPLILSGLLLIFDYKETMPFNDRNPNFVYGQCQAVVSVSLLVLCFIVTVGCLIMHQRYNRRFTDYIDAINDMLTDDTSPQTSVQVTQETAVNISPTRGPSNSTTNNQSQSLSIRSLPTINEGLSEDSPVVDIEDLFSDKFKKMTPVVEDTSPSDDVCSSGFGCHGKKRGEQCQGIVQQYQQPLDEDLELIEEEPESHDPQIHRHTVLLIMLLCSMFVGLALCIWTLLMEKNQMSGIYIELSFLDASLNFGQSILVFCIFGLNVKELGIPGMMKSGRKLWYGANTLILPTWDELNAKTRGVCEQFVTHHLAKCEDDIATDKRWRIKIYKKVFTGHLLVDWLLEVGLARDRGEAVHYARHLIEGKVLRHINSVYHFYDRNILYTFNKSD